MLSPHCGKKRENDTPPLTIQQKIVADIERERAMVEGTRGAGG